MRFTWAKTKREAVVKALEAYNIQQRVDDLSIGNVAHGWSRIFRCRFPR